MPLNRATYVVDSSGRPYFSPGLILPKTSGASILIGDDTTAANGWADIIGPIFPKTSGANTPTRATYRTGVAEFKFIAGDICDFTFHMPHDYLPGSDLYYHIHWSHTGTSISGDAVFTTVFTSARGHNQENFAATVTNTITYATTDIITTPQYRHRIDEIQLSANSPSGSQIANSTLEPDSLIIMTLTMTTLPTIGGGGGLFIHFTDLHYQTTNIKGTKNKAPNFYT
jgi:hypothetical protein